MFLGVTMVFKVNRSLPSTTKAIYYWCGFSTSTRKDGIVLQTPTNQLPSMSGYLRVIDQYDVIERELVHSFIRRCYFLYGKEPLRLTSMDRIHVDKRLQCWNLQS